MDTLPITRLDELHKHLDDLVQNPDSPLDAQLFDHVEIQLTEANIPQHLSQLLPKVATILKTYHRDPRLLCDLALKLLRPTTFTQIFTITSEDELIQALRSPAPSANVLAMAILEKAAGTPAEAAMLSLSTPLVTEFLIRWLSSPEVEVGERGNKTLIELLDTDCELPPQSHSQSRPGGGDRTTHLVKRKIPGHGKLWRRLFQDRDVFGLLMDLCEGKRFDVDDVDQVKQRSLAHGRVLRVLPRLALLNFAALTRCDFPELLPRGVGGPQQQHDSFLHYAALRMVDRTDLLMQMSLADFLEALAVTTRLGEYSPYKVETLRAVLRDAVALDASLADQLRSLPDRMVPEEADGLRRWIGEIMPPPATRVVSGGIRG